MSTQEKVPGDGFPGTGATWAGSSVTTESIPPVAANPIQRDVRWMIDFAKALDDRTLVIWALRLEDVTPGENRRAWLWQQLTRIKLRRRQRNLDVTTLDCCPRCGVVGLWWHDKRSGNLRCVTCHRTGGVS